MSATAPHTVVFWVKIPADANLLNAYAMVAWGAINKNFGTHTFHISWNRNAKIGALRTDYGKGYALGATPLRDGRWPSRQEPRDANPRRECGGPSNTSVRRRSIS